MKSFTRVAVASFLCSLSLLLTFPAGALTFSIISAYTSSGSSLNAPNFGDEITINIRMSNPSGAAIQGVYGSVHGWDASVLRLVSAEMNAGPYFCTTASCAQGIANGLSFPSDVGTGNFIAGPADVQSIEGVGSYLPIVAAYSTLARTGDGTRDPGLNGVVNGGDAQFRVVFRIVGDGQTVIHIGTNPNPNLGDVVVLANGVTEEAVNATVLTGWVPEPGTALLVGLGLAGLAAGRPRR